MERSQYLLITKTISQTIHYLNRSDNLSKDDLDEIKNQTLLKLTPQLKKILNFEQLHLLNFIRKTTRSVFWDYLKSMSADLTQYRVKKRIKNILQNLEEAKCQFKRPDNDTPWFKDEKELRKEITPQEKQRALEHILEKYRVDSQTQDESFAADERLRELVVNIFHQVDFGVSVNEIYSPLAAAANIEEMMQIPLEITTGSSNDDGVVDIMDVIPADEIAAHDYRVDERVYYENYAEEFLENQVNRDQTWVYYLRFVVNLGYKEIQKKYKINIKTAESRLSLKQDKKGFLWRLAEFVKNLELTVEEFKDFFNILDRKIGELYSNIK